MFTPSLQQNISFLPFTIKQYYNIKNNDIIYPEFDLGFNLGFINAVKENCSKDIIITDFDKKIIALQFYINEINEQNLNFSNLNILHPSKQTISNEIYTFDLYIPTLDIEIEFCEFIINNNITDVNNFLLCEIAKYISALYINNVNINMPKTFLEKTLFLSKIPSTSLVLCMKYIDSIKADIKQLYYKVSDKDLKYNASSLVP